jgi:mannose-6-phosphate isomerase-like protein (cupin superfamily)
MSTESKINPYWLPGDEGKLLPRIGLLKASSLQTDGAFEIIEYTGPAAPPPHIHEQRDEAFFVLNGLFKFILGTEVIEATPGAFIFVPRGTRHGFSLEGTGRALLLVIPAGLEGFFEELGRDLEAGRSSDEIRASLAGKYDSRPAPSV